MVNNYRRTVTHHQPQTGAVESEVDPKLRQQQPRRKSKYKTADQKHRKVPPKQCEQTKTSPCEGQIAADKDDIVGREELGIYVEPMNALKHRAEYLAEH